MTEAQSNQVKLSRTLNERLTSPMLDLGFEVLDRSADDPIHKFWEAVGGGPDGRRFLRKSPLGYDTFECRFTQYIEADTGRGFVGVGTEIGIYVEAFEAVELQFALTINPYRVGKRLSNIQQIQPEIMKLRTLDEIDTVAATLLHIIHNAGIKFWSAHTSLDDVQRHFESWSASDRHSPKGAAHVSNYLLLIAYLKCNRTLFEHVRKEYQPHLRLEIYEQGFEHRWQVLDEAFNQECR